MADREINVKLLGINEDEVVVFDLRKSQLVIPHKDFIVLAPKDIDKDDLLKHTTDFVSDLI